MGRKRTRAREFIFLCIAGLIFCVLFGCALLIEKDKAKFKREETQKQEIQKEELQKEEALKILSKHLARAKKLLEQRDFDGSLMESQKVLDLSSQNPPGDEALFNMGLIYAHFRNPKKDYSKSIGFFRRLMGEYPQSPLVEQTRVWVRVLQESEKLSQTIQKLNQVIEESKHVDIEIEERKREKAK